MRCVLWLDDIRPNPYHYEWSKTCRSVDAAKTALKDMMEFGMTSILFDLDHDLGDYAICGGDGIDFVNWLIENFHNTDVSFSFHFHSMNPVGVQNMRNAIRKYWVEV